MTYVTGSGTNGQPISYTVIPSSSPSYVPTPYTYINSKGDVVTDYYVATPSGWETTTYVTEIVDGRAVTEVTVPTSSGVETYVEQTHHTTSSRGGITSYIDEVTSNGGDETITKSYTKTINGGSQVTETITNSSGVTETYQTETLITPSGATYTYEDVTVPSGTIQYTTEDFTTPDFGTGQWVTEVTPSG